MVIIFYFFYIDKVIKAKTDQSITIIVIHGLMSDGLQVKEKRNFFPSCNVSMVYGVQPTQSMPYSNIKIN